MKRLLSWLAFIIALVGWDQFLLRPVQYYLGQHNSVAALALELLKPINAVYPGDLCLGWLFIAASAILIPIAIVAIAKTFRGITGYIERSEIAISVLETKITVEMLSADKASGRITRRQKFHANRDNVGAYRYSSTSDAGDIQKNDISSTATVDNDNVVFALHKTKRGKTVELIESYSRKLPRSWWATYLPDNVVLALYEHTSILDKKIVERCVTIVNNGEFDVAEPLYQLTVNKNPMSNIYLTLSFFETNAPSVNQIRCMVISENAVTYLTPEMLALNGRVSYEIYVKRLFQQTLRFEWTN